jgi:hypothetical protein
MATAMSYWACKEGVVAVGKSIYYLSGDRPSISIIKDQPPPDLRISSKGRSEAKSPRVPPQPGSHG